MQKKATRILSGILGGFLVFNFFYNQKITLLSDWSSPEKVGQNTVIVLLLIFGIILLLNALLKRKVKRTKMKSYLVILILGIVYFKFLDLVVANILLKDASRAVNFIVGSLSVLIPIIIIAKLHSQYFLRRLTKKMHDPHQMICMGRVKDLEIMGLNIRGFTLLNVEVEFEGQVFQKNYLDYSVYNDLYVQKKIIIIYSPSNKSDFIITPTTQLSDEQINTFSRVLQNTSKPNFIAQEMQNL